jgi:DNA polymerase III subunit delta'
VRASETATDLWADVVGQERAATLLRSAAGSPVHAYLVAGQEGWGARAVARAFAAEVLSQGLDADAAERVRHLVAEDSHADAITVEPEGNQLRKDEVDELIRLAYRHPTEAPYKVLVLPRFDSAGPVAWSRLLKVLEEPPPSTVWVLLADDPPAEMATIVSRAVVAPLDPVPPAVVAARLVAEGSDPAAAEAVASAVGGDLVLARLLVGDERLALRREAWAGVPERLDGSGHAVWRLVAELRAAVDDALEHVKRRFDASEADLAARIDELGLPKARLRELAESHRRQLRRARTAELRLGLATLAGRYRDALADADPGAPAGGRGAARRGAVVEAVAAIDATYEALLVRNANEALQLQALLLRVAPLRERAATVARSSPE